MLPSLPSASGRSPRPLATSRAAPAPPRRAGAGITLYLQAQSTLFCGFLAAGLLALPNLLSNGKGGVLTSIGLGALGTTYSLGNRLPWSVRFWPPRRRRSM